MATRISGSPAKFNTYINNGDDYLQAGTPTNGTRLGLSGSQQTEWTNRRVYWRDTLYPKFTSKAQRTEAVVEEVHNFIRDFRKDANPVLDMMAANQSATAQDEKTFNFVKRENRKKPERKTEAITELCFGTIQSIGGGVVKNGCRSDHDTKRPSLADGADGVEVSYTLIDLKGATPPNPQQPNTPELIPAANDQRMKHLTFSKAKFLLECGQENSGKTLLIYHRWINSHYPKLAGPWSAFQVLLVL